MPPTEKSGAVARLFWNGRSQAVRLPREFRFEGDAVLVHREGDAVVLEPLRKPAWPRGHFAKLARLRKRADVDSLERPADRRPRRVPDLDKP